MRSQSAESEVLVAALEQAKSQFAMFAQNKRVADCQASILAIGHIAASASPVPVPSIGTTAWWTSGRHVGPEPLGEQRCATSE